MDWKKIYESPKMIKFKKKGKDIEIYTETIPASSCSPSYIKPRKSWFVAIIGKKKISDKEFRNKKEALNFAKQYMLKKVI
jgi:hypothetical protein